MGSGPSKQPSSAKTVPQKGSVENKKSSDPPLLGSSQPPKSPWAVKGSQQTGKGPADQRKGDYDAEKNRTDTTAGNEERKGSREAQETIISRPVTSSKRVKSARAGPNKTMVRQMERGIPNEDTEEIDTIIGLGRERTRLQIKREKTRVRDVLEEAKRKKTLSRFQSATKQLRAMKTFEHPMSKEEEVFIGNVGIECPSTAKVVRIFTSSTFTVRISDSLPGRSISFRTRSISM